MHNIQAIANSFITVNKFSELLHKVRFTYNFSKTLVEPRRAKPKTSKECLVVNPIIVDGYASLFNCMTAVRASDPMTASS